MERWGVGRRSLVLDNRASAYLGRIFCLAPTTSSSSANPASNFCSLSTSFVSGSSIERGREGRPGRRLGEQQQAPGMGGRRRPVSVAGIRYPLKESDTSQRNQVHLKGIRYLVKESGTSQRNQVTGSLA